MATPRYEPALLAVPGETREQVRRGIQKVLWQGETPTLVRVREVAKVGQAAALVVLRSYRAGVLDVEESWLELAEDEAESSLPTSDLSELIRAARNDEDRAQVQYEIAARLASGALQPSLAKAIKDAMAGGRQSQRAHRDACAQEDEAQSVILCTPTAARLAKTFDRLVSEDRRNVVIDCLLDQFEADIAERPGVDTGGL